MDNIFNIMHIFIYITKGKKTRHSDKKYEKATGEVLAVIPSMPR